MHRSGPTSPGRAPTNGPSPGNEGIEHGGERRRTANRWPRALHPSLNSSVSRSRSVFPAKHTRSRSIGRLHALRSRLRRLLHSHGRISARLRVCTLSKLSKRGIDPRFFGVSVRPLSHLLHCLLDTLLHCQVGLCCVAGQGCSSYRGYLAKGSSPGSRNFILVALDCSPSAFGVHRVSLAWFVRSVRRTTYRGRPCWADRHLSRDLVSRFRWTHGCSPVCFPPE